MESVTESLYETQAPPGRSQPVGSKHHQSGGTQENSQKYMLAIKQDKKMKQESRGHD